MTTFPIWGALAVLAYLVALVGLSYVRSRGANLGDYLLGGRNSTWWLLTIGLISDSVSGVTYVSVPGAVATQGYSYLQVIFGHFFGYQIIAFVLLPLFYRLNVISIYSYLRGRFGIFSEKTGATLFVIGRLLGAAARLYIATLVLHSYFFAGWGISPLFSFVAAVALIVVYTYRGGIKALVWTDAFQSVFLLLGIGVVFSCLARDLPAPMETLLAGRIFVWDPLAGNFFGKHFIGGVFITVAMNGLDQNIMQKNLSCARLKDAQKNMVLFGFVLIAVNLIFVGLGALLLEAYRQKGLALPMSAGGTLALDRIFPEYVFTSMGELPSVFLVLGLFAATLSSADSVLPTLSSSIQIDLMNESQRERLPIRRLHLLVSAAILVVIFLMYFAGTRSLIDLVLKYSGYISGPLLGLFGLGILTRVRLRDRRVPFCALAGMGLTAILDANSAQWLGGYRIGYELVVIHALVFVGVAFLFARSPCADPGSAVRL